MTFPCGLETGADDSLYRLVLRVVTRQDRKTFPVDVLSYEAPGHSIDRTTRWSRQLCINLEFDRMQSRYPFRHCPNEEVNIGVSRQQSI